MRFREIMARVAHRILRDKMAEHRGNACAVARDLGLHRNSLTRLFEKYGVDRQEFRSAKRRAIAERLRLERQRTA